MACLILMGLSVDLVFKWVDTVVLRTDNCENLFISHNLNRFKVLDALLTHLLNLKVDQPMSHVMQVSSGRSWAISASRPLAKASLVMGYPVSPSLKSLQNGRIIAHPAPVMSMMSAAEILSTGTSLCPARPETAQMAGHGPWVTKNRSLSLCIGPG